MREWNTLLVTASVQTLLPRSRSGPPAPQGFRRFTYCLAACYALLEISDSTFLLVTLARWLQSRQYSLESITWSIIERVPMVANHWLQWLHRIWQGIGSGTGRRCRQQL